MRKIKKWIIFVFALTLLCGFTTFSIFAQNSSEFMDMNVNLDKHGDAIINLKWKGSFDKGTELYLPYSNLPGKTVNDLFVKMDGKPFEPKIFWDTKESFESKAFRSGIIDKGDGAYELCFGISEYGTHTYDISFKIPGMVFKTSDGKQLIFFKFILNDMNPAPQRASVSVKAPFKVDRKNAKIWGFGCNGNISFKDGLIFMESDRAVKFDRENYITILTEFKGAPFEPQVVVNKSSLEIRKEAFKNSDYDFNKSLGEGSQTVLAKKVSTSAILATVGAAAACIGVVSFALYRLIPQAKAHNRISKKDFKLKELKSFYWREEPFENDVSKYIYALYDIGVMTVYDVQSLLTGAVLEAIYKGLMEVENDEGKFSSDKKPKRVYRINREKLELLNSQDGGNSAMTSIFNMINEAAGDDGVLTKEEIQKYGSKNYKKFIDRISDMRKYSYSYLKENGNYTEEKYVKLTKPLIKNIATEKGNAELKRIVGFKNYLKDYSLIGERDEKHVKLWDRYMIDAGYLGIADEVKKQFEKIYPELPESERAVILPYQFDAAKEFSKMTYSAVSIHTGGGGKSSFGGGGGSFGGGGGGGAR